MISFLKRPLFGLHLPAPRSTHLLLCCCCLWCPKEASLEAICACCLRRYLTHSFEDSTLGICFLEEVGFTLQKAEDRDQELLCMALMADQQVSQCLIEVCRVKRDLFHHTAHGTCVKWQTEREGLKVDHSRYLEDRCRMGSDALLSWSLSPSDMAQLVEGFYATLQLWMSFEKGTVGRPTWCAVDTLVHFIVMGPRELQQTITKVSALLLPAAQQEAALPPALGNWCSMQCMPCTSGQTYYHPNLFYHTSWNSAYSS